MPRVDRDELANVIAVNLARARDRAGLSKTALAQEAGVTEASLRNWEKAQNMPRTAELVSVADALGVSVHWLLGRETGSWTPGGAQ